MAFRRNWKRGKNRTTEQDVKRAMARWIVVNGGEVDYNIQTAFNPRTGKPLRSPFIRNGRSDLSVAWFGICVCIEVKRPAQSQREMFGKARVAKGRLSPHQADYLDKMRRRGGAITIVATSVEEIASVLLPLKERLLKNRELMETILGQPMPGKPASVMVSGIPSPVKEKESEE